MNIIIPLVYISFLYSSLLTGLDIIEKEDFKPFHNKNIALLINHTSVNNSGVHILDLLSKYKNINIKSVFTPEHGLEGNFSAGEKISSNFEEGLQIISLYGNKREPLPSDLSDLDYIVIDIQDIGSRYYTYISTVTYVLNAASKANVPVIILDRPNPLGREVFGPIISPEFYSFVGMHPIPIRHGMTIAELSLMINNESWLPSEKKVDLHIYSMQNWDIKADYFSIPPSPNISNFNTALIYNGMCLLEGTNISEGRGTKEPFLLFGAPWMNSKKVLEELINYHFAGIKFYQKTFKPISIKGVAQYPKYENQLCYGIKIEIIDGDKVNPIEIAVSILKIIYKNHPKDFSFNDNNFISKLYGSDDMKINIINKDSILLLSNSWTRDSAEFMVQRKPYLLY